VLSAAIATRSQARRAGLLLLFRAGNLFDRGALRQLSTAGQRVADRLSLSKSTRLLLFVRCAMRRFGGTRGRDVAAFRKPEGGLLCEVQFRAVGSRRPRSVCTDRHIQPKAPAIDTHRQAAPQPSPLRWPHSLHIGHKQLLCELRQLHSTRGSCIGLMVVRPARPPAHSDSTCGDFAAAAPQPPIWRSSCPMEDCTSGGGIGSHEHQSLIFRS